MRFICCFFLRSFFTICFSLFYRIYSFHISPFHAVWLNNKARGDGKFYVFDVSFEHGQQIENDVIHNFVSDWF